jgi:quercetin dioxygenase-like cupin family protein
MAGAKVKICLYTDVPSEVIGHQAAGASMRWLIDNSHDGAPVYALRMIELAPSGHTLHHQHAYEHQIFVLEGQGRVFTDGVWHPVGPGHVVFLPGGIEHELVNAGDSSFRFLCGDPLERQTDGA